MLIHPSIPFLPPVSDLRFLGLDLVPYRVLRGWLVDGLFTIPRDLYHY